MNTEGKRPSRRLLDRMGETQAQALLARLDQWLSQDQDARDASPTNNKLIDRDQLGAPQIPYDRRKSERNGIPQTDSKTASRTPKDQQS
jgi:hypothetical protein